MEFRVKCARCKQERPGRPEDLDIGNPDHMRCEGCGMSVTTYPLWMVDPRVGRGNGGNHGMQGTQG
jgi:DNA-directed RNA polymerase subunit RPC12/RpoP